jgi:hypothetical protein
LQWHTGGALYNLLDNCEITFDASKPGMRSSHTGRTSRPKIDAIHTPAGPGNVVWNCDFVARGGKIAALDLGHEMNDWVIAYNRWLVPGSSDAPVMRMWYDHARNFDFIGNVMAVQNASKGGLTFVLDDASKAQQGRDVRFRDNRFFGWPASAEGKWWTGPVGPDADDGNALSPEYQEAPRPSPIADGAGKPIASLHEWQLAASRQAAAAR